MACFVLFLYILSDKRFNASLTVLVIAVITAFVSEVIVLYFLRGRKAVKKVIKLFLVTVINVSVFSFAVIYGFSSAVILQPHSDENSSVMLESITGAENVSFEGSEGRIDGWIYKNTSENTSVILYFYGNYETAATRLNMILNSSWKTVYDGYDIAVFDYPSYGRSEGSCSDEGLCTFAVDVFDELSNTYDDVTVIGYSVGTGPATYLAANRDISSLTLYAPYADGYDLYNNVIDVFHGVFEHLVSFNINSKEFAKDVEENVLIFASSDDETIPLSSSLKLSDSFNNMQFVRLQGIGHNDFFSSSEVLEKSLSFLREVKNYE